MKKFSLLVISAALALVLGARGAGATIVSPPTIEIDANRGDKISNTIKIKNDGATRETYYLTAEAFTATGEDGQPSFKKDGDEAVNWINFDFKSIVLQEGQATTVPFTLNIPQAARSGGHYIAVFASTTPPTVSGTGVGIAQRIGSLILVRVEGETVESARIAEFSSDKDSYGMLPAEFAVRLENNGNVHLKPLGEVVVRGMFGKEATRLKVNAEGGNVLPNSIRRFTAVWGAENDAQGFFGRYLQQKQDKLIGKYTAELTMVYGQNKVLKDEVQFWVMPWERIIVDLVLLVIAVAIIAVLVKKYNGWVITRAMEKSSRSSKK